MKAKTLALTLLSLTILSSCCKPKIEYVDRVEYLHPQVPEFTDTAYPPIELKVWGDYAIYKQQCQAQIDKCNADKSAIIDSILTNTD
jgi:hypothetical protein